MKRDRLTRGVHTLLVILASQALFACGSFTAEEKRDLLKNSRAQAEMALNVSELRRAVLTVTGQVEEFNERAQRLTDNMARLEKAFNEVASHYRTDALERNTATDLKLQKIERELAELSYETAAFIKLMEKKSGITSRSHRSMVETLRREGEGTKAPEPMTLAPQQSDTEPDELYQDAYNRYLKGDHAGALEGFKTYHARFPQSPLADNALFWQGEAHFAMGNYARAAITFDDTAARYPSSAKAPVALLRSADAFLARNDNEAAANRLMRIMDIYPSAPEAAQAKERLDTLEASPPGQLSEPR